MLWSAPRVTEEGEKALHSVNQEGVRGSGAEGQMLYRGGEHVVGDV